ncbi:hypothetical protein ACOHYD_11265 [Desulfobacterota bacterium M19]
MRVNTSHPPLSPPPASSGGTSFSRLLASRQEAVINITTDEGDRISISTTLASRRQTEARGNNNGLELLTTKLSGSRQSIQVQGDLNPTELADLGRLLDDLSSIANDFFKGDTKKAVSEAMNLGDMGSLNRVEASFTNTTTAASRLTYHPVPGQTAGFSNLLTGHKTETGRDQSGTSLSDILQAQWQQFTKYLDEQAAAATSENNRGSHKSLPEPDINTSTKGYHDRSADPGETMMTRARKMINRLPRLTPLVPAVGDLAINKAAAGHDNDFVPPALIRNMRHNFHDAFRSWML